MNKRWTIIGFSTIAILGFGWLWYSGTLSGGSTSANAILKQSLADGKPVVVFFYSHDCPQCELMKEPVERVREEFSGEVAVISVDADDIRNQFIVRKAGVFGVPTLVFYSKDGRKQSHLGAMNIEELRSRLFDLEKDTSTTK